MEKEYSLDEAIKMLKVNSKLKFETVGQNDSSILYADMDTLRCIDKKNKIETHIYLTDKWILVQQPVSFIEAINSGKQIRCEGWTEYRYMSLECVINVLNVEADEEEQRKAINGKWYIKED